MYSMCEVAQHYIVIMAIFSFKKRKSATSFKFYVIPNSIWIFILLVEPNTSKDFKSSE